MILREKLKLAIKLVLKYKVLQRLEGLQELLMKILRKNVKDELSSSEEYKVFLEMVRGLEKEEKMKEVKEVQSSF